MSLNCQLTVIDVGSDGCASGDSPLPAQLLSRDNILFGLI